MLTYNMDVEERSTWLRATPGAAALAQPFYCTEAGNFYGRAHLPRPVPIRKVICCFIRCPAPV